MLFSDRASKHKLLKAGRRERENLLEMLIGDFRRAFPELTFELQLDFKIINAQSLNLQGKRIVTIYGGLALHPRLAADSLTLILLHEVGHHLADGCRLVRNPSLACECASDHWAVTTGMDTLLQKSGRRLWIADALEELDQIMSPRQQRLGRYTKTTSTSGCWARGWSSRNRALFVKARSPTTKGCCINYV